jgi:hypothetical protein
MRTSDTLGKLAPALVAALAKIEGAAKKGTNPAFAKGKNTGAYATLESVIDGSRAILAEHKLAVLQGPGPVIDNCITLTTRFLHDSGEWIETDFQMPLGKTDPQGTGSALTYARRYSLMAMLNMPAVDDDAEAAHGRSNAQEGPIQGKDAPDGRLKPAEAKRRGIDATIKTEINACDLAGLLDWEDHFDSYTATLPIGWLDAVHDMIESRRLELMEGASDFDDAFRETMRQ